MRVLVACEESQTVCIAFRKLGIEAYSCDIQECSGGHPEWHIHGDAVAEAYSGKYDLMIAHPPCTYFSTAGAKHLFKGNKLNIERYEKLLESRELFMKFYNSPIKHICIENVRGVKIAQLPQFTQEIQPYQYGHNYSKATRLWLKNLPLLKPTNVVREYSPYVQASPYKNENNVKRKGGDKIFKPAQGKKRSKTFEGIAEAMAEQWSKYILR